VCSFTTIMKLRLSRVGFAGASALLYPTVIALVAGVITFRVVPVFAESSAPFACDHPAITRCEGKANLESCECASGVATCACQVANTGSTCIAKPDDGGVGSTTMRQNVPGCYPVTECTNTPNATACAGKGNGASCTTPDNRPGTCTASFPCFTRGADGKFTSGQATLCVDESYRTTGGAPIAERANEDDEGCSTSSAPLSSGGGGGAATFAVALGAVVGLLWKKRRNKK